MSNPLKRWALLRMLHAARATLVRKPTPETMRAEVARASRLIPLQQPYSATAPEAIGSCTARWIDAPGVTADRVILYLHGGGFIAESPLIHEPLLAAICVAAGARGMMVRYRLAPEHPFPAAPDDCLAAYRHLLGQGIDPRRIVIAGDSAGGNLAVVTAMRARDTGLPPAAALVLLSPVLDATFSGDSVQRNDGLDPMFRAATLQAFGPHYLAGADPMHPHISPLWASLEGLPPSLLIVGSSEILLDDSTRYATRAGNATLQVWHDMPHVFTVFRALDEGPAAIRGIGEFIRRHTGGG